MTETQIYSTPVETHAYKDEKLLVQAAKADPAAFEVLYKQYVQSVYKYLLNRTGNKQIAEDLTAQTFLSVLEGIHAYQERGYFSAWLFSIARRKVNDHFRTRNRETDLPDNDIFSYETNYLKDVIRSQEHEQIIQVYKQLSEKEQELIRLRYIAALSFPEIGAILHKRTDAVKKATYRLIERMRAQLEVNHE